MKTLLTISLMLAGFSCFGQATYRGQNGLAISNATFQGTFFGDGSGLTGIVGDGAFYGPFTNLYAGNVVVTNNAFVTNGLHVLGQQTNANITSALWGSDANGALREVTLSGATYSGTTLTITPGGTTNLWFQDSANKWTNGFGGVYDNTTPGQLIFRPSSDDNVELDSGTGTYSRLYNLNITDNNVATLIHSNHITTTLLTVTEGGPSTIIHTNWLSTGTANVSGDVTASGSLIFEGSTPDENETTFAITDPTADRTITVPNASGTIALVAGDIGAATATTPAFADDDTSVATTAFVVNERGGTNGWGSQAITFSLGRNIITNMSGDITITSVGGVVTNRLNEQYIDLNPSGATRVLTVPADWYVSGFTNATVVAITNGTWAEMCVTALVGRRTNAVINFYQ